MVVQENREIPGDALDLFAQKSTRAFGTTPSG